MQPYGGLATGPSEPAGCEALRYSALSNAVSPGFASPDLAARVQQTFGNSKMAPPMESWEKGALNTIGSRALD
jgi:hypothetical protein